jgi:hypothetical protein
MPADVRAVSHFVEGQRIGFEIISAAALLTPRLVHEVVPDHVIRKAVAVVVYAVEIARYAVADSVDGQGIEACRCR